MAYNTTTLFCIYKIRGGTGLDFQDAFLAAMMEQNAVRNYFTEDPITGRFCGSRW